MLLVIFQQHIFIGAGLCKFRSEVVHLASVSPDDALPDVPVERDDFINNEANRLRKLPFSRAFLTGWLRGGHGSSRMLERIMI